MSFPLPGLFVTGTDTGVGKTIAAGLILGDLRRAGYRPGAYKPACSGSIFDRHGCERWEDVEALRSAAELTVEDAMICPQQFRAAVAPPQAARIEGRTVQDELLTAGAFAWEAACDVLVVEGAGGWLSPLSDQSLNADVAERLGLPVLVVARAGLGTINHTLLTVESIHARGLAVAGVVLNSSVPGDEDLSTQENAVQIERFSGVSVLGRIHFGEPGRLLSDEQSPPVDWFMLAGGGASRD